MMLFIKVILKILFLLPPWILCWALVGSNILRPIFPTWRFPQVYLFGFAIFCAAAPIAAGAFLRWYARNEELRLRGLWFITGVFVLPLAAFTLVGTPLLLAMLGFVHTAWLVHPDWVILEWLAQPGWAIKP